MLRCHEKPFFHPTQCGLNPGSQAAVAYLGLRARCLGWPHWRLDTLGYEPEEEYVKSWDPSNHQGGDLIRG
ncbi:MAG: hypothetical protein ACE5IO_10215 [Thermoplasmata archaeon]